MPPIHRSRRAILSVTAVALAACASEAGFDARMQPLVGLSETELVSTIGVPDGTYSSPDGRRFLQYDRLAENRSTGFPAGLSFGIGGFGFGGGGVGTGVGLGFSPGWSTPTSCSVTFELRAARVESYTKRGTCCVAGTS